MIYTINVTKRKLPKIYNISDLHIKYANCISNLDENGLFKRSYLIYRYDHHQQ
uniref:Uncharacterized protein n=1 Tax=Anguilla anguilla TaxID=7936 RepID=A0A0E9PR08_ANGAN